MLKGLKKSKLHGSNDSNEDESDGSNDSANFEVSINKDPYGSQS